MINYHVAKFINKIEAMFLNYFDLNSRCPRKEFNTSMFIISMSMMGILYMFSDLDGLNQYTQNKIETVALDLQSENLQTNAQLSNDQLLKKVFEKSNVSDDLTFLDFLPPVSLFYFISLFFLPLFYRRINDSSIDNKVLIPVVLLYAIDFLGALLNIDVSFSGYGLLTTYSFVIITALMFFPTREEEIDLD